MTEEKILESLLDEIAVVTQTTTAELLPDASFNSNNVNSLEFIEILLFIKQQWGCDFILGGLNPVDVASPVALSCRIASELNGAEKS